MKILLISHSTANGGAETAFRNLVACVREVTRDITILFPHSTGPLLDACLRDGLACIHYPIVPTAGQQTTQSLFQIAPRNAKAIAEQLRAYQFDLVLTNTSVMLFGLQIARLLGLAHVSYIHEWIGAESDCRPQGWDIEDYFRTIINASDHLLCCSSHVQRQVLALDPRASTSVLDPFLASDVAPAPADQSPAFDSTAAEFKLLVIGTQSIRKNPIFALTVLQALKLRGWNVSLHFIGHGFSERQRIDLFARKKGIADAVTIHAHSTDPYALATGQCINLVCALAEPFGLTVPECLVRGIPVVASRSGGPETMLPDDCLYAVNDLDESVRKIEAIFASYPAQAGRAREVYGSIASRFAKATWIATIGAAIDNATTRFRPKADDLYLSDRLVDAVQLTAISHAAMIDSIAAAAARPVDEVLALVALESAQPGSSVERDCKAFDVVPFAPSPRMDQLRREGVGAAIEAVATCMDGAHVETACFMSLKLMALERRLGRSLRVLVLGDAVGACSMRLASLGCDVDCLDATDSLTARVARSNFERCQPQHPARFGRVRHVARPEVRDGYDAVVASELIERQSKPQEFLSVLSGLLRERGLLFISDGFDAIRTGSALSLADNEQHAGLLPLMCARSSLEFVDLEPRPANRLLVFARRNDDACEELGSGLGMTTRRLLLQAMVHGQLALGI